MILIFLKKSPNQPGDFFLSELADWGTSYENMTTTFRFNILL